MISIDKSKALKPAILNSEWVQKKLLKIKDEDKPGKSIDSRYNDIEVKDALNQLYHHKCAYCEGMANSAKFSSRIDHYRPKNGIKVNGEKLDNHKGYFWLGYEWTNLVPTCEKCNLPKSNEFPIRDEAKRISDQLEEEGFLEGEDFKFEKFTLQALEYEEPLLLNPELHKVEEHLYFVPTGEVKALTQRGRASIERYQLNRGSLVWERKKIAEDIFRDILKLFADEDFSMENHPILLLKIWKDKVQFTKQREYSRFRFFVFHFFDAFVIQRFEIIGLHKHANYLRHLLKEQYSSILNRK